MTLWIFFQNLFGTALFAVVVLWPAASNGCMNDRVGHWLSADRLDVWCTRHAQGHVLTFFGTLSGRGVTFFVVVVEHAESLLYSGLRVDGRLAVSYITFDCVRSLLLTRKYTEHLVLTGFLPGSDEMVVDARSNRRLAEAAPLVSFT